jgi:hypothetical protein
MKGSKLNTVIALSLLIAVSLGCGGMRRPWRDYSQLKFDSKAWLAGDAIDRGRMVRDIVINRIPNGKISETVKEQFGEPDLQKTIEGRKVWLYKIDLGAADGMDHFAISFDEKGRAMTGMISGSKFSAYMKSGEL